MWQGSKEVHTSPALRQTRLDSHVEAFPNGNVTGSGWCLGYGGFYITVMDHPGFQDNRVYAHSSTRRVGADKRLEVESVVAREALKDGVSWVTEAHLRSNVLDNRHVDCELNSVNIQQEPASQGSDKKGVATL